METVMVEIEIDPDCTKCEHPRSNHKSTDEQGCTVLINYESETNSYERCHCMPFEGMF